MRFIHSAFDLILKPFRALLRILILGTIVPAAKLLPRLVPGMAGLRTLSAKPWRHLLRWAVILFGLIAFFGVQLGIGYLINGWQWYLLLGLSVIAGLVTLAAFNATYAFLAWLFLSPWVRLFLGASIGGLPVDFDRIALLLIAAALILRSVAKREPMRKLQPAEWLLVLSTLYISIPPMIHSSEKLISFARFNQFWELLLTPAAVYLIARAAMVNRRHISIAAVVMILIGFSWGLSGIYEQIAGHAWFSPIVGMEIAIQGEHDIGVGRSVGPSQHYYIYGLMLVFGVFLAYHAATWTDKWTAKIFYYIGMVVMVVGLYFGYSRAPYIAFGVSLLLASIMMSTHRRRYVALTVVVGIALLMIVPVIWQNPQFQERMTSDTATGRLAIAATCLNIAKAYPWFGAGVGKYSDVAMTYRSSREHTTYQGRTNAMPQLYRPHNEYLLVLAEQGIVGWFFYFGAMFGLLARMFRVRSQRPGSGVLGKNFVSTAIVFVVTVLMAMFGDEFQLHVYMYYVLFAVFGIVAKLGELDQQEALPEEPELKNQLSRVTVGAA